MPAIHILRNGFPLCGFTLYHPRNWPEGHKWVDESIRSEVTCKGCLAVLAGDPPTAKGEYTCACVRWNADVEILDIGIQEASGRDSCSGEAGKRVWASYSALKDCLACKGTGNDESQPKPPEPTLPRTRFERI